MGSNAQKCCCGGAGCQFCSGTDTEQYDISFSSVTLNPSGPDACFVGYSYGSSWIPTNTSCDGTFRLTRSADPCVWTYDGTISTAVVLHASNDCSGPDAGLRIYIVLDVSHPDTGCTLQMMYYVPGQFPAATTLPFFNSFVLTACMPASLSNQAVGGSGTATITPV